MSVSQPYSNTPRPAPSTFPPGLAGWLMAALLLVVLLVVRWMPSTSPPETFEPRPISPAGNLAADEKATIDLFQASSHSVVYITTTQVRRDALSRNIMEIPQGSGSGFIWDEFGHIVTNYHVISQASRAQVILSNTTTWDAELVGSSPDNDLSVLKITAPADQLHPIQLGTSRDLQVGQKAFAIGNPFGLDQTLTVGVISGLNRQIRSVTNRPIQGVIQTDAAINPGNSGGPLLDSSGRLIGVNTAIVSPSGAYAGIGFAVPVDTVNRIVPQLIQHGKVIRPGLGITIADDTLVRRAGLKGVLIMDFSGNGAAEQSGLRNTYQDDNGKIVLGDLIVGINDKPVTNPDDLYRALDGHSVGEQVTVHVKRDSQDLQFTVTLQPLP